MQQAIEISDEKLPCATNKLIFLLFAILLDAPYLNYKVYEYKKLNRYLKNSLSVYTLYQLVDLIMHQVYHSVGS